MSFLATLEQEGRAGRSPCLGMVFVVNRLLLGLRCLPGFVELLLQALNLLLSLQQLVVRAELVVLEKLQPVDDLAVEAGTPQGLPTAYIIIPRAQGARDAACLICRLELELFGQTVEDRLQLVILQQASLVLDLPRVLRIQK